MLPANLPVCDWHHHSSGSSSGISSPDPAVTSFFLGVLAISAVSVSLAPLAGLLAVRFTGRIRSLLWSLPLTNILIYMIVYVLRTFPPRESVWHVPGGLLTVLEIGILLLLTLLILLLLMLILWLRRFLRRPISGAIASAPTVNADTPRK